MSLRRRIPVPVASLVCLVAVACSSGGGTSGGNGPGDAAQSDDSPGGPVGDGSSATDATAEGASTDGRAQDGAGSDAAQLDAGPSDGSSSDGAAAAGGPTAVAAFCTQGCNREGACATMLDAGTLDVNACITQCETTNDADTVALYRADYMASVTSCRANASCADTLGGQAAVNCSATALAAITPSAAVVAMCQTVESLSCVSAPTCLSQYKVLSDATIQALSACFSAPGFCANVDAGDGGASCLSAALTPH